MKKLFWFLVGVGTSTLFLENSKKYFGVGYDACLKDLDKSIKKSDSFVEGILDVSNSYNIFDKYEVLFDPIVAEKFSFMGITDIWPKLTKYLQEVIGVKESGFPEGTNSIIVRSIIVIPDTQKILFGLQPSNIQKLTLPEEPKIEES